VGPGALALTTTAGAAVGGDIAGAAIGAGVAAAASSIATQLVATGDLNFKQVLTSTLTGAVTGGVMRAAGWTAGQLDDVQADLPTRAAAIAGRATFQGGLQELTGGHFKDGFTTGLTSGIADELSARLDSAIAQNQSLSSAERGAYTLLRTAASSAVRAAANPNDALSGMATDFLGALVGDGLNSASAEYKGGQPGDSSGTGSFGTMPPSEAHFEGADDALGAPPETQHTTTAEPPAPTPEESQAAFRQSERGYRTSTDETVAHPIEPAADDAALPTQVIEVVGRHMTPGEELAYDTEQWIRQRAALADGFWLTQQDAAVDDSSPTSFVGSHISRLLAQAGADTAVGSLRLLTDPETQIATIRGAGDALTHPVQTAERIWNGVEALMAMPADERGDAVFKAAVAVALPAGAPRSLVAGGTDLPGLYNAASEVELEAVRGMGNRGARNTDALNATQVSQLFRHIGELGLDPDDFLVSTHVSAYSDNWDKVFLGPNIFPADVGARTVNSVFESMTPRAAVAHEAGHMITTRVGTAFDAGSLFDEVSASLTGRDLPGLNSVERYQLLRDAVERARLERQDLRDVLDQMQTIRGGE